MRHMRTAAGAFGVAVAAVTLAATPAWADHGGPHCDELPANITPEHPDWDDSLDDDGDGVACEDGSKPVWHPPLTGTVPDTAPPDTVPPVTEPAPPADVPEAPPAPPVVEEPDYTG